MTSTANRAVSGRAASQTVAGPMGNWVDPRKAAFGAAPVIKRTYVVWVGLLLGLSAATVGVNAPISSIPIRPRLVFLALAVLLSFGVSLSRSKLMGTRILATDVAIIVFMVAMFFVEQINSTALNYNADTIDIIDPLFWLLACAAARSVITDLPDVVPFIRGFTLPVFIVAPLGVAQSLNLGPINAWTSSFTSSIGFTARLGEEKFIRAIGLSGHWTAFGSYLSVIVAAAAMLLVLSRRRNIGSMAYPTVALMFAGIGLVTTLTFSSVISGIIIILVAAALARIGWRFIVSFGLVAIVSGFLLSSLVSARLDQQFDQTVGAASDIPTWVPGTLRYRAQIWETQTIPMIQQRPVTGWGGNVYDAIRIGPTPGRIYPSLLNWISPESQWFGTMMNYGLIGFIGLMLVLLAMIVILLRALRLPTSRLFAWPMLALIVMSIFSAFTAPVFTNQGLPLAMWPLFGVVAAIAGLERRGQLTVPVDATVTAAQ